MSFGGEADESESAEIFAAARDAGINLFDCADVYQKGRSEEILGRLIAPVRDDVVLTSKVFGPVGQGPNDRGASRYHLRAAVEASLRRFGTDRIDLYFIHRFDEHAAIDDTLRTLDDLVRAGKILYPALSNFAAWQIQQTLGIAALHGWAPPVAVQPMYSLAKRQAEVEILPMAAANGLGVLTYSPLGGGLLSGKYGATRRPAAGRLVDNDMYKARYGDERYYDVAGRFSDLAAAWGHHPVSLAIAWVAAHPSVTAPLIGARNVEQLKPALDSVQIDLTPEQREEISRLSPAPPLATDRDEEALRP